MAPIHPIAAVASLGLLEPPLRRDVAEAIRLALRSEALFPVGGGVLPIFRQAIAEALTSIEERGDLLARFLKLGPYEDTGPIPPQLRGQRLGDEECAKAITFIYSHVVNAFQGRLAELLALASLARLLVQWQRDGSLSSEARIYVGDAALPPAVKRGGLAKGADFHVLSASSQPSEPVVLHAVVEVKSFACSYERIGPQIEKHVARAAQGLSFFPHSRPARSVRFAGNSSSKVLRVFVAPGNWHLSRRFRFVQRGGSESLETDPHTTPERDVVDQLSPGQWMVTLRWSREALASAAYELTFWYMAKLGERIYGEQGSSPWPQMSPGEAGRNAAKMMLYYAIGRCSSRRVAGRAIALYNAYGFGYSLGANFRDREGRRDMLFPEDLREILAEGETKHRCRIRP